MSTPESRIRLCGHPIEALELDLDLDEATALRDALTAAIEAARKAAQPPISPEDKLMRVAARHSLATRS